ncbi:MAG: S1 family peptidase [Roseibacillus sp.]
MAWLGFFLVKHGVGHTFGAPMNKWQFLLLMAFAVPLLPKVLAEPGATTEGRFYRMTKSEIQFYVDGERHEFKEAKTEVCNISAGSVVVVKYRSRFVYTAALCAFVYQDRSNWIPIHRPNLRVLDNTLDPKEVTAEMIENSATTPPGGRLGKPFAAAWENHDLPSVPANEWFGVSRKNEWGLYGFVVTEEKVKPLTVPRKSASTQLLTHEQLSGIVLIEGDEGVGSGFLTEVEDELCVVTNLHVLGNNKKFTITTLSGQEVKVDVKSIKGAIGADIALLGVAEGHEELFALASSEDVLETTAIGKKVVVVGNRLGGGVATQTLGQVRGIGPTRIEVDAQFQSGNSGRPIYDIESSEVVGVASYTETIPAAKIGGDKVKDLKLDAETRWFGYRIDTVKKWQAIEWGKWRQQVTALDGYYQASRSGLSVLQGKLGDDLEDETVEKMVASFKRQKYRFGNNGETRALLSSVSGYLNSRKAEMDRIRFYHYFQDCPYWSTNVADQKEFRADLIEAMNEAFN